MKHKYDIQSLLLSAVGYKGLPYPGVLFPARQAAGAGGSEYQMTTQAAPRQEFVRGTRLWAKSAAGRWYFMPVYIRHPRLPGDDHTLELENALISLTGRKKIVSTEIVGRRGSVKELISTGDYTISIAALIHASDGSYPDAQIARMKELFRLDEAVELISVLTDLVLGQDDRIVITDMQFPSTPGLEEGQVVTLECETDTPFELNLDE